MTPDEQLDGGWLNRNVVGMGLTSLLSDAGHEMATAVLPGFLTALGAPPFALGFIEGFADALSSFVKLGAGWWSDRIGHRKGICIAGYALTGSALAVFAFAASWPLVFLGRVAAWFGRGIRSPLRSAMLAESVPARDRGKAFGFHRAGDTVGAILGPLVGGGLLYLLQPYATQDPTSPFRTIFLLTLIPGLGSAAAFAWLVREKRRAPNPLNRFWASVRALPGDYRRYLLGAGVFGIGDFSPTLLILAAAEVLTPDYGVIAAAQIGTLLYAFRNAIYAAASYPVGHLGDRYGRRGLLVLGFALGAVMAAGAAAVYLIPKQGPAVEIFLLALVFAVSGMSVAIVDSLEGATTADLVPDESVRGLAYGVLGTVNGVGDFVSSALVGLLWSLSPLLGFLYAAGAMAVGAALLLVCGGSRRPVDTPLPRG